MDRYHDFLSTNLPKYISNPYIDEVIIADENGNDYNLLLEHFSNETKLKVFRNETILGPFLNKLNVLRKAKNQWIVLIDSDNFADLNYFETIHHYISTNSLHDFTVLMPSFAKPNFNYKDFENQIMTKNNIKNIEKINNLMFNCLINTGNYVLNKKLVDNISLEHESKEIIETSSACDVKYFNLLLLEQFPEIEFHVVKNLEYHHVVHANSIYLQTCIKFQNTINIINNRFKNFVE